MRSCPRPCSTGCAATKATAPRRWRRCSPRQQTEAVMSVSATGSSHGLDVGKVMTDGLNVLARNFGPLFLLALLLQGVPSALSAWDQVIGQRHALGGLFTGIGTLVGLVTTPMLNG